MAASNYTEDEVTILIKAAPTVGETRGEVVCCAGITDEGRWLRLYPIPFRNLKQCQQFGRWDRVKFRSRRPKYDSRIESRRVEDTSIEIVGKIKQRERDQFLERSIVTNLTSELENSRTLALLKSEILDFKIERRSAEEMAEAPKKFVQLSKQMDLFGAGNTAPYRPCPYKFIYKHTASSEVRNSTCQDWEIEATFFNICKRHDEKFALEYIQHAFGEKYPKEGMLFGMGTHSRWPDRWLLNGIIKWHPTNQDDLLTKI